MAPEDRFQVLILIIYCVEFQLFNSLNPVIYESGASGREIKIGALARAQRGGGSRVKGQGSRTAGGGTKGRKQK